MQYVNQFIRLNCYFIQGQLNWHHLGRERWCLVSMIHDRSIIRIIALLFVYFISFFNSNHIRTHMCECVDVPQRANLLATEQHRQTNHGRSILRTKRSLLNKAINSIASLKWLVYNLIGRMCRSMSWYERSVSLSLPLSFCLSVSHFVCELCVFFCFKFYVESKRSLNIT